MLPPKSVWIEAPMLATTFRERTVIPRTTPRLAAIRYPSKVNAVVTHCRGMGTRAAQLADGSNVAMDSPREIPGNGAPPLILRCTTARLYYPTRPRNRARQRRDSTAVHLHWEFDSTGSSTVADSRSTRKTSPHVDPTRWPPALFSRSAVQSNTLRMCINLTGA